MTVFIVVYIRLTESQAGAKYLKRGLMNTNLDYYKGQVKRLKAKVVAYAFAGNTESVDKLEKEIANYEKFIRQNEPKGFDSYLS